MNSSYFGSFAKRTFCDLFELNVRTVHTHLHMYEVFENEIIGHKVVRLPINEVLDDAGYVASCFTKVKNTSYVLGLLVENSNIINELSMNKYKEVVMVDTDNGRDLSYCKERNKDYIELKLSSNKIHITLGKKQSFYIDGFNSITHTPMSEYDEIKMNGETLTLDVTNLKKD